MMNQPLTRVKQLGTARTLTIFACVWHGWGAMAMAPMHVGMKGSLRPKDSIASTAGHLGFHRVHRPRLSASEGIRTAPHVLVHTLHPGVLTVAEEASPLLKGTGRGAYALQLLTVFLNFGYVLKDNTNPGVLALGRPMT